MPNATPVITTADLKPLTIQLKTDDGKRQTLQIKTIRLDKLSIADRETLRNLELKVRDTVTPQGRTVHVQATPVAPAPQN